ncbi:hypothetical protein ES707_08171 [subsurface metagenome]
MNVADKIRELVAQCRECLCFETLFFRGNTLMKTKRFKQGSDQRVYHDCGTDKPCRLFPRFVGESPVQRHAEERAQRNVDQRPAGFI